MNRNTVIIVECSGSSLVFSYSSEMWITDISSLTSNDIVIDETQGTGQIGTTVSNLSVQPKDITVEGFIKKNITAMREGLLAILLPQQNIKMTVQDGTQSWYIQGYLKKTPVISDGLVMQNFQFVLHCPYPYFRSTADGSAQIAGLNSLFAFPCSLSDSWYISKYSESLFAEVANKGNVPTEFSVVFTAAAAVTNPEFYHVEKQSYIKINKIMQAGEKITVSTVYGRKGVTVQKPDGTFENGFKYLDVNSDLNLQLAPGDNTIRCGASVNRQALSVKVIMPQGVKAGL